MPNSVPFFLTTVCLGYKIVMTLYRRMEMPRTEKRIRPRTGYVMVELSEEERAKLERLTEKRKLKSPDRASLAGTFRGLLKEAKE